MRLEKMKLPVVAFMTISMAICTLPACTFKYDFLKADESVTFDLLDDTSDDGIFLDDEADDKTLPGDESETEHKPTNEVQTKQSPVKPNIFFGGYSGDLQAEESSLIKLEYSKDTNYSWVIDEASMNLLVEVVNGDNFSYSFEIDQRLMNRSEAAQFGVQFYHQNGKYMNGAYSRIDDGNRSDFSGNGTILHDIADFAESGVYFFVVTFKCFDSASMKYVCLCSKPLYIDLQIDPNPVIINQLEKKEVSYSNEPTPTVTFKGKIFKDSIYRIESDHSGEGGYPASDGIFIATNIKNDEQYVTIQRFYNISVNGRTAKTTMTLPQDPPINLRN